MKYVLSLNEQWVVQGQPILPFIASILFVQGWYSCILWEVQRFIHAVQLFYIQIVIYKGGIYNFY
jgi:hypothetical protein